jgi:cephalosporin hydroxylase
MSDFQKEVTERIAANGRNAALKESAQDFMRKSIAAGYSYNYSWMGRPIIQYPQDMVVMQQLVWATRPDLIVETGIAHGGSLILSASLLALLDLADAIGSGKTLDPSMPARKVLGIDIDIRAHNRAAIEAHPMSSRIEMIQGSSIDASIVSRVREFAKGYRRVMVCLDSNHTHDHVLGELRAYADLTTVGCYCVVFDSIIEDLPKDFYGDRPWGIGDNPKTAVHAYLEGDSRFEIDHGIDRQLLISVAPHGYLKRVA